MLKNPTAKFIGWLLVKKEALAKTLGEYFLPRQTKVYWLIMLAANLLLWLLAWRIEQGLHQDLAILHYNITFGIDYLAARQQIYWLPLIALILSVLNGWLSMLFFKKDMFLANLLLASALAVNFMVGLGLYSIYLVNFVKIF